MVKSTQQLFQHRIQKLFKNAGFEIIQNIYTPESKLIICGENVKILIKSKHIKNNSSSKRLLENAINEIKKANYDIKILALLGIKIPEKYSSEIGRKILLQKYGIVIFNEQIIEYYEDVVKSLNEWAKYVFFGDFKIDKEFGKPFETPYIKTKQGNYDLLLFRIPPEIMLKIAYIFRREFSPEGYQRLLTPNRIKKQIPNFLKSEKALLPTPLVCVFDEGMKFKKNLLSIPLKSHSLWVVDGQHRLYSFCYVKPEIRQNFELICVGLDGTYFNKNKQAEIFIDINEKPKKISKLLLLDLYELVGLKHVGVEIVKELNKSNILKDKIKLPRNKNGVISLVTFATTTPMKKLSERGLVKIFEKRNGKKLDFNDDIYYNDYKEFCVKVFEKFFEQVKEKFPKEWNDSSKYFLVTDRGIRGLLRLMLLIFQYNSLNKKKFDDKKIVEKCLDAIKNFDFNSEAQKGKNLGEGGSDVLVEGWSMFIRNQFADFNPRDKKEFLFAKEIEPTKPDEITKILQECLKGLGNDIIGELAYIDETTFDYLKLLGKNASIRLMVSTVKDESKCVQKLQNMKKDGWSIKIKKITKAIPTGTPYLHERWIGGENKEVDIGSDLKKSSISNRKHTISVFHNIIFSEKQDTFKQKWNGISKFGDDPIVIEDLK